MQPPPHWPAVFRSPFSTLSGPEFGRIIAGSRRHAAMPKTASHGHFGAKVGDSGCFSHAAGPTHARLHKTRQKYPCHPLASRVQSPSAAISRYRPRVARPSGGTAASVWSHGNVAQATTVARWPWVGSIACAGKRTARLRLVRLQVLHVYLNPRLKLVNILILTSGLVWRVIIGKHPATPNLHRSSLFTAPCISRTHENPSAAARRCLPQASEVFSTLRLDGGRPRG